MAKYEVSSTLKVQGQPDVKEKLCCPDERCLLDCWDAWDAAMGDLRAYRESHPHDESKGKRVSVSVSLKVTRDGKPHVTIPKVELHDFPEAALPYLDSLRQQLKGHPAISKVAS